MNAKAEHGDTPHEMIWLELVTDFKLGVFDIDLGLGFGLASGSDQMIIKTIIGYAFPVPGASSDSDARSGDTAMMPKSMARIRRDNALSGASMLVQ